jgi:UDP-glucose 4-epimerase
MKGEHIFITGGAGYLGKNLIKRYYEHNEITVFSRDEAKHYYLKKQFPKVRCIIGDIRDERALVEASRGHTIGIFAASLKQIEAVDQNVWEGVQTIIHGAINSRRAAVENGLKAATFISSDKSRCATTLYGAMKYVAGEAFIVNAETEAPLLSSVIYGNVLNSTGSVIPLIWDAVQKNYELTLYGEQMTRFMIDTDRAIDCIEYGLTKTGYSIAPNLKSHKVRDLFEIYAAKFGLRWKLGAPRIGEKYHEQMISPYETARVSYNTENDMYLIHYKNIDGTVELPSEGLSSENRLVSKVELEEVLSLHNFFKP